MKRYSRKPVFSVVALIILVCALHAQKAHAQTVEVRDENGKPLAGALVSLWSPGLDALERPSDAGGTFSFPPGWSGLTQIVVHAPGHALWWRTFTAPPARIDVQLKSGAAIEGHVRTPGGAPVAGARVKLYCVLPGQDGEDPDGDFDAEDDVFFPFVSMFMPELEKSFETVTGADGRYAVKDLPEARDTLVTLADDRFVSTNARTVTGDGGDAPALLARIAGSVDGRVVDAAGQPVAGAKLFGVAANWMSGLSRATTGADGRFNLTSLDPGPASVAVWPHAAGIALAPMAVTVKAGEKTNLPDIKLENGAIVEVLVRDAATGLPLPNVGFEVTDVQTERMSFQGGRSDAKGTYRLHVAPGPVRVSVLPAAGYAPAATAEDGDTEARITIAPGETKQVIVEMNRTVEVAGVATLGKGAPAANVLLRLGDDYRYKLARTDATGHFRFNNVAPRTWTVSALPDARTAWEVTGAPEIKVETANLKDLKWVLKGTPTTELRGRAVDESGRPVAGARVVVSLGVSPDRQPQLRRTTTDTLGRYSLRPALPGWTIGVQNAAKSGMRMTRAGKAKQPAKVIGLNGVEALDPNAPLQMEDTVLAHVITRSGRVIDEAGKPVANAEVLSPQNLGEDEVRTNDEGLFEMRDTAPGAARFLVGAPQISADITSAATDLGDITLRTTPLAPLSEAEARVVMDGLWKAGGRMAYAFPAALAHLDVDAGLAMLKSPPNDKVGAAAQQQFAQYLAKNDMALLRTHPELTDALKPGGFTTQELAFALAEQIPDVARKLRPDIGEAGSMEAAAFAARLQDPGAAARADAAIAVLRASKGTDQDAWNGFARTAGKGSATLARRVIEAGPAKFRTAMRVGAATSLADYDLEAAAELLKELREQPATDGQDNDGWGENDPQWAVGSVTQSLVTRLVRGTAADRERALQLALATDKKNNFYPAVRALAAAGIEAKDPARALALLKETCANKEQRWGLPQTHMRLEALIGARDPAQGAPLLAAAWAALQQLAQSYPSQNRDEKLAQQANAAAIHAFYAAPYEPGSVRVELENMWARATPPAPVNPLVQPGEGRSTTSLARAALARTMGEVDGKRALEMARALPDENISTLTQSLIALRALMPEPQKRTASFSSYESGDGDWLDGDFYWPQ